MSAADRREELEAAIWRANQVRQRDWHELAVKPVLAAAAADAYADAYADAAADERAAGQVVSRLGRARLEQATAEAAHAVCMHRARVAHRCAACGGEIGTGQRYTCTDITRNGNRLPRHIDGECVPAEVTP